MGRPHVVALWKLPGTCPTHLHPPRGYSNRQLQKTILGPGESIFLLVRGALGVENLVQDENKCHSNWSVNCSPSSLEHCFAFQPSFFNSKLKLSRFKQGIIKWKMSTVTKGNTQLPWAILLKITIFPKHSRNLVLTTLQFFLLFLTLELPPPGMLASLFLIKSLKGTLYLIRGPTNPLPLPHVKV